MKQICQSQKSKEKILKNILRLILNPNITLVSNKTKPKPIKNMKNTLSFLTALLLGSLVLVSCNRQKEDLFDQSAFDNASADAQFNDLDNLVSDFMNSNNDQLRTTGSETAERTTRFRNCGTTTIDTAAKTILIDFGTGTTCNDGRTRSGKIRITYTGRYMTPGSVITATPEDYFVNNVKVEGIKTITNITQEGQPTTHRVVVNNGRLTFSDNTTFSWQANRVRVWQQGQGDLNPFNDIFQITGTASGVNRRGKNFTAEITTPLILKTECWLQGIRKPVSGVYVVTAENSQKTVDFGNGTCDRTVTVTFANGRSFSFSVPE